MLAGWSPTLGVPARTRSVACPSCPRCENTKVARTVKVYEATGTKVLLYGCSGCGAVLGAVPLRA